MYLGLWGVAPPANADEPESTCRESAQVAAIAASYSRTGSDAPQISIVGAERPLIVAAHLRVTFGPHEYAWDGPTIEVEALQSAPLDLEIPAEAYLDPLADRYVATLSVRLTGVDIDGRGVEETALPNLFVVWPDGPAAPPVVWDRADLAVNAPYGVLDPDGALGVEVVRVLGGSVVQVLPPLPGVPDARPAAEGRERITVPVDDNTDR